MDFGGHEYLRVGLCHESFLKCIQFISEYLSNRRKQGGCYETICS